MKKITKNTTKKIILLTSIPAILILTALSTLIYGLIILPQIKSNMMCIQVIQKACFLGTPLCYNFPTPCHKPPLWFPETNNTNNTLEI